VVAYFAVNKIGAILVPLNPRLNESEIKYIIDDANAKVLMFSNEFQEMVASLGPDIGVDYHIKLDGKDGEGMLSLEDLCAHSSPSESSARYAITPDDPHQIIYTSGTTGFPKGAIITHGQILWNATNAIIAMDITSSDITLNVAPLFHTVGWHCNLIPQLIAGGTVILKNFQPEEALALIEKEKVTFMGGVSVIWLFMMQSPEFEKTDLRSLRLAWSGGAPLPQSVFNTYKDKNIILQQAYGATEVGPWAMGPLSKQDALRKYNSIGKPVFCSEMRIVNEKDEDVGIDEVGEIIFRGPHVTAGYWNNPEATKETIRDGWFYTGDLVKMDEEGFTYIVDRKKDMYKSGGENIYPVEIENVLYSHPKIAEVAVVGVPDKKWGEVGKAIAVCKPGQKATEEEIIEFCKAKIAKFKVPKSVEFIDALPRTPAGKLLKRELREKYWSEHDKRVFGGGS
jgi:fatty-acyl-CoA synthase